MLNPNDKVLVYRNGHLLSIGIAGPIRGFSQTTIAVNYGGSYGTPWWIEVDRETGRNNYHEVKAVTDAEWSAAAEKLHQTAMLHRLREDEIERAKEEELQILGEKAEVWYKTLPEEQQKMIDALVWKWHPIAVA